MGSARPPRQGFEGLRLMSVKPGHWAILRQSQGSARAQLSGISRACESVRFLGAGYIRTLS